MRLPAAGPRCFWFVGQGVGALLPQSTLQLSCNVIVDDMFVLFLPHRAASCARPSAGEKVFIAASDVRQTLEPAGPGSSQQCG